MMQYQKLLLGLQAAVNWLVEALSGPFSERCSSSSFWLNREAVRGSMPPPLLHPRHLSVMRCNFDVEWANRMAAEWTLT